VLQRNPVDGLPARVVKRKAVRRAELLDQAITLFLERGYENVSLNDLLATAGTSKGAFYHYFPSKEALVTALAERSAAEAFEALRPVFAQPGTNALDRLNAGLRASYQVKVAMGAPEQLAAMTSLLKPQNQALFRRIVTIWEDLFRPVLTEVITQGCRRACSTPSIPRASVTSFRDLRPACRRTSSTC
jgi:AcrR family transcriptional regulator